MPKEIERKFLVKRLPKEAPLQQPEVRYHGYFQTQSPDHELRVVWNPHREWGRVSIKVGKGLVREELEVRVPAVVAETLYRHAEWELVKTRAVYGAGDTESVWEIDQLVYPVVATLAEIELATPDESLPPLPKGLVLGAELTNVPGSSNREIAQSKQLP